MPHIFFFCHFWLLFLRAKCCHCLAAASYLFRLFLAAVGGRQLRCEEGAILEILEFEKIGMCCRPLSAGVAETTTGLPDVTRMR
jgi:hypothetical protein